MENNIFAKRVKEYRIALNMTQEQLGEAIGLSKQAINDIEQGRRETKINRAILLARLFNTTVEFLTGETNNPARPTEIPFIEHLFFDENAFLFSKRLRELREKSNISIQKVGNDTHFGTLRYKNLETGEKRPDFSALIILADYFDVSIDYLVGRSDDPKRH